MTFLLNPRFVAALMVAFFLAGTHWKAYRMGEKEVQTKWDQQSLEIAKQSLRLTEEATRTTTNLQAKADQISETKNAQIARINSQLDDALERLRERPERHSEGGLPSNTTAGSSAGCTGDQLFKQDAEFLVREASRADRLLADLKQCQAAYSSARQALNK